MLPISPDLETPPMRTNQEFGNENKRSYDGQKIQTLLKGERILLLCIIGLSLSRLAHQSLKFLIERKFIDLAYHYFYSTMIRLGLNPFNLENVQAMETQLNLRHAGGLPVYTPSYFVFFQPLTLLPFPILSALWLLISLTFVFLSVYIVASRGKEKSSWTEITFILVVVSTFQPLYEDLALGQNNTFLLLLITFAWLGERTGRSWLLGTSLALMAFVKIHYGFLMAFLLLIGHWNIFLISSFVYSGLFLAGLPQLGLTYYANYISALIFHTSKVSTDIQNISINGQWQRFLGNGFHQATIMYVIVSLILTGSILRWCFRHRTKSESGVYLLLGLILLPLLSPHTEVHHLVPLLLPLAYAALHIAQSNFRTKILYLLSVVLLASRFSWISFVASDASILDLLLSLKILGVFFLLIVMIKIVPVNSSENTS